MRGLSCIVIPGRGEAANREISRHNFEIPDRSAFRGSSGMTGKIKW
jgi:hypothetical protein